METAQEETRSNMERLHTGDTIRTFKGLYIDVFNPDPATIDIEDIAHALSQVCRFAGHTPKFYSVAQHCTECVTQMRLKLGNPSKKILLTMLMHDAAEAYIGDMARPIKRRLPQYKQAELILEAVIGEKFGLDFPFPPIIKTIDNLMLEIEHDSVILKNNFFQILSPSDAEGRFLNVFTALHS